MRRFGISFQRSVRVHFEDKKINTDVDGCYAPGGQERRFPPMTCM